jgi:hypothetical protein
LTIEKPTTGSSFKPASVKSGVVTSRTVVSLQPGEEIGADGQPGGSSGSGRGSNFVDQGGLILKHAHV